MWLSYVLEYTVVTCHFRRIKGLGEADDDPVLDSAAAWVAKSRMQEKERLMAEKRVCRKSLTCLSNLIPAYFKKSYAVNCTS